MCSDLRCAASVARIATSVFQCSADTSGGFPALLSMSWFNLHRVLMRTLVIRGRIHFSHTLSVCPHIIRRRVGPQRDLPALIKIELCDEMGGLYKMGGRAKNDLNRPDFKNPLAGAGSSKVMIALAFPLASSPAFPLLVLHVIVFPLFLGANCFITLLGPLALSFQFVTFAWSSCCVILRNFNILCDFATLI